MLPKITMPALEQKIYLIRGQKVILSHDLAKIYEVETKALNQAVKRNIERFPDDFMFQLDEKELELLRSQIVTSSWGGSRYLPLAFTEQGVAMLSGVLKSPKAIQANIAIMRTFVALRDYSNGNKLLAEAIKKLEHQVSEHSEDIETIFEVLRQLTLPQNQKKHPIGFIKKL